MPHPSRTRKSTWVAAAIGAAAIVSGGVLGTSLPTTAVDSTADPSTGVSSSAVPGPGGARGLHAPHQGAGRHDVHSANSREEDD